MEWKNQYIQLAAWISYKSPEGDIVNYEHEAIGNKAIAFVSTSGIQMELKDGHLHHRQIYWQMTGYLLINHML